MTIRPTVRIVPIHNGAAARCSELSLAGHGRNEERALDSLRRSVLAWCHGLAGDASLEQALTQRGVAWRDGGPELLVKFEAIA